jgi:hypothetical protein
MTGCHPPKKHLAWRNPLFIILVSLAETDFFGSP